MPLVSVLTPIFNGEKHLRACLESVINQTYQDWEYIIVDNCSRDKTVVIAEEYASSDRRIRIVINTTFVGIIENHNIAFSEISPSAEYCKVVQADDWIYPDCLEKFVKLCEENPTITLASAYRIDNDQVGLKVLPPSKSLYPGREIARGFFFNEWPDPFGSPTSYFLRAGPVRAHPPFFNPSNMYADVEACLKILREGDFGFIHEVLTFTRRPADAQTPKSHYLRVNLPSFLWILKNHGRVFLSDEEYGECVRKHLRHYYLVMARDLVRFRRNREYWLYHFDSLRKLGYPLNLFRLLATIPKLPKEKSPPAGNSRGLGGDPQNGLDRPAKLGRNFPGRFYLYLAGSLIIRPISVWASSVKSRSIPPLGVKVISPKTIRL
jgi:glycosyltransferase involved in cell wall biosynthesis